MKIDHQKTSKDEFMNFFKLKNIDISIYKNNIILDVGCGTNNTKKFFEKLKMKWFGVDIIQSPDVIIGDMNNLPFPDIFAHVIYCSHAFEHSEHPVQTLKEFKRVVKPGGIIFISTPYPTFSQIFSMDKTHINVLNEWQISKLFKYVGIELLQLKVIKPDTDDANTWNIITIGSVV